MKYLPLLLLVLVCGTLALGLTHKPASGPFTSALIGKPLDQFSLTSLDTHEQVNIPMGGKVTIINVFASWCESCIAEHPMLLAAKDKLAIIGIAWKDKPEKITAWLTQRGNPYQTVLIDEQGSSTLHLALSGVPETFVIDKRGVVAYNNKAPLTSEDIDRVIAPLVEKLNAQ